MARNTRTRPRDDDDDDNFFEGAEDSFTGDGNGDAGGTTPEDVAAHALELAETRGPEVAIEYLQAEGVGTSFGDPERSSLILNALSGIGGDSEEWDRVVDWGVSQVEATGGEFTDVAGDVIADEEAEAAAEEARDTAIDAAAEVYGQTAPGVDPDLSSIEELVPEGLDPNERERWLTDVITQGRADAVEQRADDIQGSTGADEGEAQQLAEGQIASDDLFGSTEPDWLLQMNGGTLSEQQKQRYVDYWNDAYGTFLTDFDTDLAPILSRFDGTETEAQNFANAVLADQEPLISHSIELPFVSGTRKATYSDEQLADLRAMGYSNGAITRLVRLSAFADGPDSFDGGGQDFASANLRAFAALTRYYGGGDEFGQFDQRQDDITKLERELGLSPGAWGRMTAAERQLRRAELEQKQASARALRGEGEGTPFDADLERMDQIESLLRSQGLREEKGRTPGILAARNDFTRGLERYRGDEYFALIYAVDPHLAQRLEATGGNPDDLEWQDNAAIYDILEQGGVLTSEGVRLRQSESSVDLFGYFSTGGGRGGGGRVRTILDPASVGEQLQQTFSRYLIADVPDGVKSAVYDWLQGEMDAAEDGQQFDTAARILAWVKARPEYEELYHNKPAGIEEAEYQGQFAAGIADVIGNELDPEALKSGMRTGDYQAAVGRASASDKLLTNSTLRGRWAQAKQVLDQFT